jgi:hypothetical protein
MDEILRRKRKNVRNILIAFLAVCAASLQGAAQQPPTDNHSVAQYDVHWSSLGSNEKDSMPIGNGDIAANVWTDQSGELVILLAKSDAYTETGKLVKLGRIRIRFAPAIFSVYAPFTQTLNLEQSAIEMTSGSTTLRLWIDANHPALHVEVHSATATRLTASLETWRIDQPLKGPSQEKAGMSELGSDDYPVSFHADTILPATHDAVTWYHFNQESIYPTVLRQQHLESMLDKYPDPLLHRCFGAQMSGPHLVPSGDKSLTSVSAARDQRLDIVALTQTSTSVKSWRNEIASAASKANPSDLEAFWEAHVAWWNEFWNRSWIDVSGDDQARAVSQGYVIQRYMVAASSRGELPVKFNGGLFTVGRDLSDRKPANALDHNPDYRAWGNSYWNQNNRLIYWPLIESGDLDLLHPWFNMYLRDLPLAKDRTQVYYHHAGASLPETMFFWGTPNMHDFGWNNPTDEIQSRWQRYHIQGTLEVIAQMLDVYDETEDHNFAKSSLVPFADAIVTYYDQHWPRGADGKIRMYPTQSLETYQLDVTNPTPDIGGLRSVLPRLIALPSEVTTPAQVAAWQKTLRDLPPIPIGRSTRAGKTPPAGKGDSDGFPVILPAESYGGTSNSENPELYTTFPYRLYGVVKPDLNLARDTFAARRSPQNTCWGQDGTMAAALGLTYVAKAAAVAEFTNYGEQRFLWFWRAAHDWIPDLDNGGDGMITLQSMLLQTDGRKILLLPAWPKEWTADFRLHAAAQTTVEGHVENGKLTRLNIWPASRAKDVTYVEPQP